MELKHCEYPKATKKHRHGLQPLPNLIPIVSSQGLGDLIVIENLGPECIQNMVCIVSKAFATAEPMARHLINWSPYYSKWELIAEFINCCVLKIGKGVLTQSIVLRRDGKILGAALNETLVSSSIVHKPEGFTLREAFKFLSPIFTIFSIQQAEAIPFLEKMVTGFSDAFYDRRVGHHFMVARGNEITGKEARCLVSGSMARYKELGFTFVITEATSTWTGAVIEALGGVRVHFAPYRAEKHPGISPDGYLSDKDSGSMLYVLRLNE